MKVNFFSAQLKLWARIFDYKGTSSKKEYWFAFIFHVIIGALVCFNLFISAISIILLDYNFDSSVRLIGNIIHYAFLVLALIKLAYLIIAVIPWIALTVRRLRDAGKSAWWTLLLLVFGIGHIVLFIICATASGLAGAFMPSNNRPEAIYGPPEMLDPSYDPFQNFPGEIYGPPDMYIDDYDPKMNEPQPEYGPPVWDDYDPDMNVEPTLYGPPIDIDPSEYDDNYDPDLNVNEDVYGPPEWFE